MKFARLVFGIAAVYGFVSLVPLYFMMGTIGRDAPPAITHAEFYYGFIGLGLLWQVLFLIIAARPIRYRPIMLVAILEKFIYTMPVILLYCAGRVDQRIFASSLVDPVFGILFIIAYLRTRGVAFAPADRVWPSANQ
ncbi:MAG TPA: hypothetical protein VG675_24380 [Bryobacteraceae bacterium]|nr:hypothetical protein [Bryobacteraceae bacterium]